MICQVPILVERLPKIIKAAVALATGRKTVDTDFVLYRVLLVYNVYFRKS